MAEVHSSEIRSFNMSRIRDKNSKPELILRKFLHSKGFRYRLHVKNLPGKPDIVLPKYKTVIFVNGCFWHGHEGCKYFVIPKTRTEWWISKIKATQKRDRKKGEALKASGWKVRIVWECELRSEKIERSLNSLLQKLKAEY
jgi:DNA mismatch endonuclease (patch repair protein)